MSVQLKTVSDIASLREGGQILGQVLDALVAKAAVGVTGKELDELAQELIAKAGAVPAFLNYAPRGNTPFPAALCVSINDAVVHGIPTSTPFVSGDVVSLDLGLIYHNKFYLDSARTVAVGAASPEVKKLLSVTKLSLERGIAAATVGNRIGDIGHAIQQVIEDAGFGIVHQLVGHGVGYAVHEEPQVPNFGRPGTGLELRPGLVIAIEPMVTVGDPLVETAADGWTMVTADGSLAAHEEHTVAITTDGPVVLTRA